MAAHGVVNASCSLRATPGRPALHACPVVLDMTGERGALGASPENLPKSPCSSMATHGEAPKTLTSIFERKSISAIQGCLGCPHGTLPSSCPVGWVKSERRVGPPAEPRGGSERLGGHPQVTLGPHVQPWIPSRLGSATCAGTRPTRGPCVLSRLLPCPPRGPGRLLDELSGLQDSSRGCPRASEDARPRGGSRFPGSRRPASPPPGGPRSAPRRSAASPDAARSLPGPRASRKELGSRWSWPGPCFPPGPASRFPQKAREGRAPFTIKALPGVHQPQPLAAGAFVLARKGCSREARRRGAPGSAGRTAPSRLQGERMPWELRATLGVGCGAGVSKTSWSPVESHEENSNAGAGRGGHGRQTR